MKPKHGSGKLDTRYTITLEHTGQPTARYVARFLHQRIGDTATPKGAWAHCMAHQRQRLEQHTGGAQ